MDNSVTLHDVEQLFRIIIVIITFTYSVLIEEPLDMQKRVK